MLFYSFTGSLILIKLLWLICHALATVVLIQHILLTFPSCASLGWYPTHTTSLYIYMNDDGCIVSVFQLL